uniref:Ribose-phosphate pyrophosphokinase N-terminal domain-containing protein n=1 Tax=Parascaris univalens TaxID=6257 RepID=A0A915A5B9_PARUN
MSIYFIRTFSVNAVIVFIAMSFEDDIIDDAQSFVAAAQVLKNRGAYKIYVIATHGLLSADAPGLLESSPITEVIICIPLDRSVYHPDRFRRSGDYYVVGQPLN